MRVSSRSIEEVREKANIVEVASEFTALRRQGNNLVGLCPYPDHSEKSPSFSVSPEKNFYHCFGCQKGGDSIKLVMELKSFSFVEAVSYLAERSGVELQLEGNSPQEAELARQRTARRRSAFKALAAATAYYHKYLLNSSVAQEARRYLESRGLKTSTIVEFRLGFAPPRGRSGFIPAARKVGLNSEALEFGGLLSTRGGERFVNRITFPISDRRGRIVGFGARGLGDAKPKYLNSPETELFNKRSLLYGFPQVAEAMRRDRSALVVEGYTDVLMLYQAGIKNAVATLGTAMTEQHLKTLSAHVDDVYLLFDPDEAGEKVLENAFFTATELKLDLRVLRLSKDPADWLLEHSAEEFLKLLPGAVSILEYGVRRATEEVRGAGAIDRARALPRIKDLVRRIEDPILKQEAIRLSAEALGVDRWTLNEQFIREPGPSYGADRDIAYKSPQNSLSDPRVEAGREVLSLLLARPDLAARALCQGISAPELPGEPITLDSADFGDEKGQRIFALLVEHAGEGSEAVLSDERARPLLDDIAALQANKERLYPSEASLRAAWFRLAALNRAEAKRQADNFDEKERLHTEMKRLSRAAAESSNLAES